VNTFSFDHQQVYKNLHVLTKDIGSRWVGLSGNKKAGDHIYSYFNELGLQTKEQLFSLEAVEILSYEFQIIDPPLGIIASAPISASPDTPVGGLEGEVIIVEDDRIDQIGNQMRGKIVLWFPHNNKFLPVDFCRYKPAAIICISPHPGMKPNFDYRNQKAFWPNDLITSFWISWEDGLKIIQAQVKRAKINLQSKFYSSEGRNVIGELKGLVHPDEIIVISAHYDSPPFVEGAVDNASGISTVMELARLFANSDSKRTLRFIAWDAEEIGYRGSFHYINELRDKGDYKDLGSAQNKKNPKKMGDQHLLCVNIDVLGMPLGYMTCHINGSKDIGALVHNLSKELGIDCQVSDDVYGSDHNLFTLFGIPSINFCEVGPAFNYIHTQDDTLDLISLPRLEQQGILIKTFIERCAVNAVEWPFDYFVPENPKKAIEELLQKWLGAAYFDLIKCEDFNKLQTSNMKRREP
jgi:hypothetical protein